MFTVFKCGLYFSMRGALAVQGNIKPDCVKQSGPDLCGHLLLSMSLNFMSDCISSMLMRLDIVADCIFCSYADSAATQRHETLLQALT